MKLLIAMILGTALTSATQAQVVTYYSDNLKAQVSIDPSQMQSSNSRAYAMMLDDGLKTISHELQGVDKETDSLKKKDLDSTLKIITTAKARALQLMDDERKKYVHVAQEAARAQAAAAHANQQYQPVTHHDFYSPAYEQLKHISATGNW
jgi:hypothetical protein